MKPFRPTDLAATAQEHLPPTQSLRSDFTASLTFALVNIPQGMANALLAGADPVRGLYTLMAATPIGGLFTGSILMNVSTVLYVNLNAQPMPSSQKMSYPRDKKSLLS